MGSSKQYIDIRRIMHLIVGISLLVLAASAAPDHSDSWEEFKEKYNKDYPSDEEETYRSNVWLANVAVIQTHNSEADLGVHTFHLGENELADLTTEEISSYYNGLMIESSPMESSTWVATEPLPTDLPTEVDWRNKSIVTDVKNQLQCGSCWAFSATGSLEGQHALKDKKLVSLSEQNLVDCSQKEGNMGCMGGLMDNAFKYVKINGGIDTEASYPYTAKNGKTCLYNATNSGATLTSWVDVTTGSEADLQKAVATVGPISVAIDASHPKFHFYKKGVYHDPKCSSVHLDHGVLAVGYGTAKLENGKAKDFWLVKNSWGKTWGMDGYINMSRNKKNNCGIATAASYPVV